MEKDDAIADHSQKSILSFTRKIADRVRPKMFLSAVLLISAIDHLVLGIDAAIKKGAPMTRCYHKLRATTTAGVLICVGSFMSGALSAEGATSLKTAAEKFSLAAPKSMPNPERKLWATWYRIHSADETKSGPAVLDQDGGPLLGIHLSHEDWCHAALEGTVLVKRLNGKTITLNHADLDQVDKEDTTRVDCGALSEYKVLAKKDRDKLGRARFAVSPYDFGQGLHGALVPFRTIAVDVKSPMLGKLVFIPAAVGTKFTDVDGTKKIHDGYFFATDVGVGLYDGHIDVFIGNLDDAQNPFKFVQSMPEKTFVGYVVEDKEILSALSDLSYLRKGKSSR